MARRGVAVIGWLMLFAASDIGAAHPQQRPAPVAVSPVSTERAIINQYCVGCHNTRTKAAGLALDTINVEKVSESVDVWEKVVRKLRSRVMPPVGRPRPDESTYDALASQLEKSLDRAFADQP